MLTPEEKIKIIELYNPTQSVAKTQRMFRTHYGIKFGNKPEITDIVRTVKKFRTSGSVHPSLKRSKDTPVRTNENIERVRQSVTSSPRTSIRRRSQYLNLSPTTVFRTVSKI